MIEEVFLQVLGDQDFIAQPINPHKKKYKIKFDIEGNLKIHIRISQLQIQQKNDESMESESTEPSLNSQPKYCVEFLRVSGDGIQFNSQYKYITTKYK